MRLQFPPFGPVKSHKRYLRTAVCYVILLLNAFQINVFAQTQVSGIVLQNGYPVNAPSAFGITFVLANTGSPKTMRVHFYLIDPSGTPVVNLGTATYSTPNTYPLSFSVPDLCYSPASGWKIYGYEESQTLFGPYSYSTNFSFLEAPPNLTFLFLAGSNKTNQIYISRVSAPAVYATNLNITDSIYFSYAVSNQGCSNASGCVLRALIDNTNAFGDYVVPTLSEGQNSTTLSGETLPGNIPPGLHNISIEVLGGNDGFHNMVQTNFFIASAPVVNTQPQNMTVVQNSGSNATFSISAAATPAPGYQWKFNNTNISGAIGSSFTILNPQVANAGNYSVVVSNYAGSITSSIVQLSVVVPPKINSIHLQNNGQISLSFDGQIGVSYEVDASSNLTQWTPLAAFTNTAGTYQFIDTNALNLNQYYYRSKVLFK